jgi:methyl-accepting chemotaxis protein-2 (aspartate sensor receptor)
VIFGCLVPILSSANFLAGPVAARRADVFLPAWWNSHKLPLERVIVASSFSRASLVKRLAVFQALVVLVAVGAFSIVLSALITRRIETRTEDNLKQQVTLLVNMIDSYDAALAANANALCRIFRQSFAGDLSVDAGKLIDAGGTQTPLLKAGSVVLNQNSEIVDRFFAATQANGSVFVRSGDDFIRISTSVRGANGNRLLGVMLDRTQPAYARLMQGENFTGKTVIAGRDFMAAYMPVKDASGKVIAAVAVAADLTADLQNLTAELLKTKIGKTGYIYALDATPGPQQGTLRIHPATPGKNIIESKDARGFTFIRDIIERKDGVTRYFWINKTLGETVPREKIVAFGYLKDWDWIIAAGSYTDELNTEGRFLRNILLIAGVLMVLLLVTAFGIVGRKWIAQPLNRAVQVTNVLADGDFRQIADVREDTSATDDEVQHLERGIYRMARSLRAVLEKIHDAAAQVATASGQISASARSVSETAQNQSRSTQCVTAAMEQMSETVVGVRTNSRQAAETARIAAETAREGGVVVRQTLASMRLIADATQRASATISELGASSDKIGAITSAISEIAGQTNLLALNAAIEAARAGEQGRGFAVVAGEVRRLAERTAAATQEISTVIERIQQQTHAAVTAMASGSEAVEEGLTRTESAGQALNQIITMAERVGEMVALITESSAGQDAAATAVNGNMAEIAAMSEQASATAGETAKACTDLSNLTLSLRETVGHFKLDDEGDARKVNSNPFEASTEGRKRYLLS